MRQKTWYLNNFKVKFTDDNSRFSTPEKAIQDGADYLVIGRPILNPPDYIGTPLNAVKLINKSLEDKID